MISQLSQSDSGDRAAGLFPDIPPKQIPCQIQNLLEDTTVSMLQSDTIEAKHALSQPAALRFIDQVLGYLFEEQFIVHDEVEAEALSFFKMYLLRTNYTSIERVFRRTFSALSSKLDRSIDNEPLVTKALNFIAFCSNWNSGGKPEKYLSIDGKNSVFRATFNRDSDQLRMFLNCDFTLVLNARFDSQEHKNSGQVITLVSFLNEMTEHGYSLYLQNDTLWFRHMLPIKGPEMLLEFKVFEKVSETIGKDWICLFFECQYNHSQKSSILRFQLNNKVHMTTRSFDDAFMRTPRQTLTVMQGCHFELSNFSVINRVLSAAKTTSLQTLLVQKGLCSLDSLETYLKIVTENAEPEGLWIFLHPFCGTCKDSDGTLLVDWFSGKRWALGDTGHLVETSGRQIRNAMHRISFFEGVLTLFYAAKSEEDFGSILKILRSYLSNTDIQSLVSMDPKGCFRALTAALVVTKKGPLFSKRAVETLFYIISCQSDKLISQFCRQMLFDYVFLDRVLISDVVVSSFFEETTKLFNSNLNLFFGLNFDRLFEYAMLFLEQKSNNLVQLKAFCILKLISQAMKLGAVADKFNIELPLTYLCAAVQGQSLVNLNVLKIVKLYAKHRIIGKDTQKLFATALFSMLLNTDDGVLIARIFKLLTLSKLQSEAQLIMLWRKRVGEGRAVEKTKKLLWSYKPGHKGIKNIEFFVEYLYRKSFKDVQKGKRIVSEVLTLEKSNFLNLLLEVSLLGNIELLEQLLSFFEALVAGNSEEFLAWSGKSLFLNWLTVLLFRFDKTAENQDFSDRALRLISKYSVNRYLVCGTIDQVNTLAELLTFYTAESGNDRLKFTAFKAVCDAFNTEGVILNSKQLVSGFVSFIFKYYFASIVDCQVDVQFISLVNSIMAFAHRTINLNPIQTLPVDLTDEISTALSEKSKILSSILVSGVGLLPANVESVKNGYCCPLKLLVTLLLDMLNSVVYRQLEDIKIDAIYEFVNAFVYRLNYYLENNSKRLKADRMYLIESAVYELVSYSLKTPKTFPYIKDMVESLFYFVGKASGDGSLNTKILKELRVSLFSKSTEFYHELKFEKSAKHVLLAEYQNKDFGDNKHEFLLGSIGKVNEAIANAEMLFSDDFGGSGDELERGGLIDAEWGHRKCERLLSCLSLNELSRHSELNAIYKSIFERQFGEFGLFFDERVRQRLKLKPEFNPKDFEYNAKRNEEIQYRQIDFTTRGFKSPFFRPKYKGLTPKIVFPKEPSLSPNFKIDSFCEYKGLPFFMCDQIDKLEMVPSFITIDAHKGVLRVYLNPDVRAESLLGKFGIELKHYVRKPHHRICRRIEAGQLRVVFSFKVVNQRRGVIIQLTDYKHIILHFKTDAEATSALALLQGLLPKGAVDEYGGKSGMGRGTTAAKAVELWLAHKISNFDFLSHINFLGCRSPVDYSQYPVFPLLVKRFDSLITLRDLEKPIGMNSDDKNLVGYQRTYEVSSSSETGGYFYGSHYSYPAHVFNMLVRKAPESLGSKAVHNGSYDFPDRIFFSIPVMTQNIVEDTADVRELLPEFFYLPEAFLNLNNYDFGVGQHGERVHNVVLPEHAKGSPYAFVSMLRQLLEGPLVSLKLGAWVDLVFGYKQFGPKAIEAKNVFFPVTYEQNVKTLKLDTEEKLSSTMNQIYNFGQTPAQLFTKAIGSRKIRQEQQTLSTADSKTRYFLRYRDATSTAELNPLLHIKKIKDGGMMDSKLIKRLLLVKRNSVETWRFKIVANQKNNLNPYEMYLEATNLTPNVRKAFALGGGSVLHETAVEVASDFRLVLGGFVNGSIAVVSYKLDKVIGKYNIHEQMVVKLMFVNELTLLTSDISGIIKISHFDTKTGVLSAKQTLTEFGPQPLLGITFCREDHRLLCITTHNSIEIRTIDDFSKRLLTIQKSDIKLLPTDPKEPIVMHAFLSLNYVSCVIVSAFFNNRNHLMSFSLLGQLLRCYTLENPNEPRFSTFTFVPDENFRDSLLITNERGDVMIFDVPFFESGRRINSNQNNKSKFVSTFMKNKIAMVIDNCGYIDILSATVGEGLEEKI